MGLMTKDQGRTHETRLAIAKKVEQALIHREPPVNYKAIQDARAQIPEIRSLLKFQFLADSEVEKTFTCRLLERDDLDRVCELLAEMDSTWIVPHLVERYCFAPNKVSYAFVKSYRVQGFIVLEVKDCGKELRIVHGQWSKEMQNARRAWSVFCAILLLALFSGFQKLTMLWAESNIVMQKMGARLGMERGEKRDNAFGRESAYEYSLDLSKLDLANEEKPDSLMLQDLVDGYHKLLTLGDSHGSGS